MSHAHHIISTRRWPAEEKHVHVQQQGVIVVT